MVTLHILYNHHAMSRTSYTNRKKQVLGHLALGLGEGYNVTTGASYDDE